MLARVAEIKWDRQHPGVLKFGNVPVGVQDPGSLVYVTLTIAVPAHVADRLVGDIRAKGEHLDINVAGGTGKVQRAEQDPATTALAQEVRRLRSSLEEIQRQPGRVLLPSPQQQVQVKAVVPPVPSPKQEPDEGSRWQVIETD